MKVIVSVGMDEITVTLKEVSEDRTIFRGTDKLGNIHQFRKNQIVRRIEEVHENSTG